MEYHFNCIKSVQYMLQIERHHLINHHHQEHLGTSFGEIVESTCV